MKPLIFSNDFLRNTRSLAALLAERARESSLFEGARGLPRPTDPRASSKTDQRSARSRASSKKTVNPS
jgi:hypothetical protein